MLGSSWRYKPQTNATIPGGFIFLSAGMNMAFSVGWAKHSMIDSTRYFCYSWFIGVIIGTLISIPLRNVITSKVLIILSSILIVVGGIIFTSVPSIYDALLVGRYLNGIGVGLVMVPFLMHASEIAVDGHRGRCLAVEQHSVSVGVAIQMIYTSNWGSTNSFSTYSLHGIFDILVAILAVTSLMFFIESPIDHIRRGNDEAALNCYSHLMRPKGNPMESNALLEQGKLYVLQEESLSMSTSFVRGIVPLVKMLFFRSLVLALCFSLPLNAAFQYSIIRNSHTWVPSVAACFRILGAFVAIFLMNDLGRKLPSLLSMLVIGGLLMGIAPLFHSLSNIVDSSNMATATYLYTCMQLAVGYFTPFTSVYLGEAFPLRAKPYLLAVSVIAEQLIQIILISTISLNIEDSLMAQGIVILVVFVLMCPTMPETKNTSLLEAQRRFRKYFYIKLT